jgi:uncharacterized glyoxalase superfamily protein PhnB
MAVHELFAYICVKDAANAIEFYRRAFGAKEKFRLTEPSGRVGHAELDFGGTTLMFVRRVSRVRHTRPTTGAGHVGDDPHPRG